MECKGHSVCWNSDLNSSCVYGVPHCKCMICLPMKIVCCPHVCYRSLFFVFNSVVCHSQCPFVILCISGTNNSLKV